MMYDSDDALDRALFALPMEEPPSDLRASILASTAYRPAPPFSVWEAAALGAIAAVTLWLVVLIALGGGGLFLHTLAIIGSALAQALSNVRLLAWLAAGAMTAYWLMFFTGTQPLAAAKRRVEGEPGT
ncbi:MAG: hypothetical protein JOZ38_03195 [Candidatus Eremiobacteraeota bacterium]|nr:hypothetical protein [Candidatus Eremiobacteraeota bacterium]